MIGNRHAREPGPRRGVPRAAAAYAAKSGGGSGCIIRRGYLVKEWGDPENWPTSSPRPRASWGRPSSGLAVDSGLVALDAPAVKHYPRSASPASTTPRDRLAEITVRQLATMTAGFDDGRPPKLVYRPGHRRLLFERLLEHAGGAADPAVRRRPGRVLKRQVMGPIGVPPSEWKWRENVYRAKTINGLPSREFASGITITHRALARIGYLYLREGEWNGRRILSREFIRNATRPTDLPSFVPYYAFFWGSNGRGTFRNIPDDAYWALGLGDSFVLVCPSLDIVAVRLGVGSREIPATRGRQARGVGQASRGLFPVGCGGRTEGSVRRGRITLLIRPAR